MSKVVPSFSFKIEGDKVTKREVVETECDNTIGEPYMSELAVS